jgi:hypothetical protein
MSYTNIKDFQKYSNVYSENEELQQSYIDTAEVIVENYLGYSPVAKHYKLFIIGNGANNIQLEAKPIQKILNIEINGVPIDAIEFTIKNEFIYYDCFPDGERVTIEYIAGFGIGDDNSIPDEIEGIIDGGDADDLYDEELDGSEKPEIKYNIPSVIKSTVLRIATLLQSESDSNIGVTSKSFGDSGSRTFINYTDYSKYLLPISFYKRLKI